MNSEPAAPAGTSRTHGRNFTTLSASPRPQGRGWRQPSDAGAPGQGRGGWHRVLNLIVAVLLEVAAVIVFGIAVDIVFDAPQASILSVYIAGGLALAPILLCAPVEVLIRIHKAVVPPKVR